MGNDVELSIETLTNQYRELIQELLDSTSKAVFPSNRVMFASILLEEMFKRASRMIQIWERNLKVAVWVSSVLRSLNDAHERGVEVVIYVKEADGLEQLPDGLRACIRHVTVPDGVNNLWITRVDSKYVRMISDEGSDGLAFINDSDAVGQSNSIIAAVEKFSEGQS